MEVVVNNFNMQRITEKPGTSAEPLDASQDQYGTNGRQFLEKKKEQKKNIKASSSILFLFATRQGCEMEKGNVRLTLH